MVGLSRFELLTPRLSRVCSNQLSYRPSFLPEHPIVLGAPLKPALHQRTRKGRARQQSFQRTGTLSSGTPSRRPFIGPILSKLDRRAQHSVYRNGLTPFLQQPSKARSIIEWLSGFKPSSRSLERK